MGSLLLGSLLLGGLLLRQELFGLPLLLFQARRGVRVDGIEDRPSEKQKGNEEAQGGPQGGARPSAPLVKGEAVVAAQEGFDTPGHWASPGSGAGGTKAVQGSFVQTAHVPKVRSFGLNSLQ